MVDYTSDSIYYGKLQNKIIYDIQFSILKNNNNNRVITQTDKGNSLEILGIVQNAVIDKFQHEHIIPDIISLTASSNPLDNNPEQFRKRKLLYNHIAKRLLSELPPSYNYPHVYKEIVGKMGSSTFMSKIKLSPYDLYEISHVLKNKLPEY